MKRILLISYNFAPELTGIGKYNGEMMDWFARKGYDCSVLTGYPYYPDWKVQTGYRRRRFLFSSERPMIAGSGKLTIYRCPLYIPASPSGVKRMLLDASFFLSAFMRLATLIVGEKYDYVLVVSPPFHLGLLGLLYRYIRGAKLIYHVQDIQIEAARDLNLIRSTFVINIMLYLERQILRRADIASSISTGMVQKVRTKRGDSTVLFPNWTDTTCLFPMRSDHLRSEFGFVKEDIVVLYSGAIGEKQGLESLLVTAFANRHDTHLKFVICGNGPYKVKLQGLAGHLGLTNVLFLPLQPLNTFNQFLNIADIHVVLQKASAADLVMPSKLAAILAVGGLALITAERGTSLHSLVREHQMGYLIDPEDQDALNDSIVQLSTGNYEYMRKNARKYAEDFLSKDRVLMKFEETLRDLLPGRATKQPVEIGELVDEVRS
jgi:colanic acid biosynthesis glycosyl transferase WcaI